MAVPHNPVFSAHCHRLRDDAPGVRRELEACFAELMDEDATPAEKQAAAALMAAYTQVFPAHEITPDLARVNDDAMFCESLAQLTAEPRMLEAALSLNLGWMLAGDEDHVRQAAAQAVVCERLFPGSVVCYMVKDLKAGDEFPPDWEPGTFLVTHPTGTA